MRHFQICFVISLLLGFPFFSSGAHAQKTELRIIFASNMPDIAKNDKYGGLAELATLVQQTREKNEHVLFLHGGDSLAPSTLSSLDRGSHMVDLLNFLEPDAMAISQRELSYFEDELTLRASEAGFPMLSANIHDPLSGGNLEGLQPWQIFPVGAFNVGVTALLSKEVMQNYLPKRITINDATASVKMASSQMKLRGADLIIVMADYDPAQKAQWIEQGIVDIIITNIDSVEDGMTQIADGFVANIGRIKGTSLEITAILEGVPGSHRASYSSKSTALNSMPPQPEIEAQINVYLDNLGELLNTEIGTFETPINTTRKMVRTREAAFGNLVADALVLMANAQIAIFNGGAIRGDRTYDKGSKITRGTIKSELPFRNVVTLLHLSGEQIWQAMENGFSLIEKAHGRFPQISGMKVVYSATAPVGRRVISIDVDGKPIDKKALYRTATSEFLANGGDGYTVLKNGKLLHEIGGVVTVSDVVTDYVQKLGVVSLKVEGRLVEQSN